MKLILVFIVAMITSVSAFADTYYSMNCTALNKDPEMADMIEGLDPAPEEDAGMVKDQFFMALQALSAGALYYANVNEEVYVVTDKQTFDANQDPDKAFSFGYACGFAWLAEQTIGIKEVLSVIDANYKLPEGAILVDYKVTN
jgi:hypothetical protein